MEWAASQKDIKQKDITASEESPELVAAEVAVDRIRKLVLVLIPPFSKSYTRTKSRMYPMFAKVGVAEWVPQSKTGNTTCEIAEVATAERSAMLETDLKP